LIGTLVYVAIFGSVLKVAHGTVRGPDRRRAAVALPAMAAVLIVLVSNALFDVLSFPHVSYLFFFICGMLLTVRERSPDLPPRRARVSQDDRWLDEIGIASGQAESGRRHGEPKVLVRLP
jgi:O-antigen ligase